jgi:hypothetical protein
VTKVWFCGAVLLASAAVAQERSAAPEYFVQTLMATATAENIAELCPTLSFDAAAAADRSTEVMERLAAEGHDTKNLTATLQDPAERVRAMQNKFLGRYGLQRTGGDDKLVCDAGMAEIAQGSEIGSFLSVLSGAGAVDPTAETAN